MKDKQYLESYIREIASHMGLKEWRLILEDSNPENADHAACAQVIYGQRTVLLWFQELWPDWTPEYLRVTVTHELLHAHLNQLVYGTMNPFSTVVSKQTYNVAWEFMLHNLELTVDTLARAWAEKLPLPKDEE